jgi:hypothetical protein
MVIDEGLASIKKAEAVSHCGDHKKQFSEKPAYTLREYIILCGISLF